MLKIRDLGINGFGYQNDGGETTCGQTCPGDTAQCEPNSACAQASQPFRSNSGALTNNAVMQLKQQLHNHMR